MCEKAPTFPHLKIAQQIQCKIVAFLKQIWKKENKYNRNCVGDWFPLCSHTIPHRRWKQYNFETISKNVSISSSPSLPVPIWCRCPLDAARLRPLLTFPGMGVYLSWPIVRSWSGSLQDITTALLALRLLQSAAMGKMS